MITLLGVYVFVSLIHTGPYGTHQGIVWAQLERQDRPMGRSSEVWVYKTKQYYTRIDYIRDSRD